MTTYLLPMDIPRIGAALRDAGSSDAEVRWVACLALAREDGERRPEAILALERLAGDSVEEVRAQAIEGLAEQSRSGADIREGAIRAGLDDPSDAVRCAALEAAAQILDDASEAAADALGDPAPSVREAAAGSIGALGDPGRADPLASLLEDGDPAVRERAALSLAALGDDRGNRALVKMLGGPESASVEAAMALGRSRAGEAATALRALALGRLRPARVRAAAAAALAKCGGPEGLEVLRGLLSSPLSGRRAAALMALSSQPVSGVADAVGRLLERRDPQEVSSAIRALAALAEEDAAAAAEIETRLSRLDPDLAAEAREVIESQGTGADPEEARA